MAICAAYEKPSHVRNPKVIAECFVLYEQTGEPQLIAQPGTIDDIPLLQEVLGDQPKVVAALDVALGLCDWSCGRPLALA